MLIASFMLGIAGALYFLYPAFVTPDAAFSFDWLLIPLTAACIGGWSSVEGSIFGALIVVALEQFFYVNYPQLSLLISGLTIVVIFMIVPRGIYPTVRSIIKKIKLR
jgi:branched-chain amino acid transport system permease protein